MSCAKLRCRGCKAYFLRESMIKIRSGNFCKMDCAIEYGKAGAEKTRVKAAKAQHKADKERVKPMAKRLAELQALVNQYVRLRDRFDACISCDKPPSWHGEWHAGHYYSRGSSSALRFNLHNNNKQCVQCNMFLSGNIGEYTPKLIKKIGQANYDQLSTQKSASTKYNIEYINRAKIAARKGIKRMKKRNKRLLSYAE